MAAQLTYDRLQRAAFAGMIADTKFSTKVTRRVLTSVVDAIPGLAVASPDASGIVVGDGGAFLGVIVRTLNINPVDAAGDIVYQDGDFVTILTRGSIWVSVDAATAIGAAVEYVPATGAFTVGGATVVANGSYESATTGANELILLTLS